jgi:hypothetical protein
MTRIMLEAFVSKFILHVCQNTKWSQQKIAPQHIPPKKHIFLPKMPPPPSVVYFHPKKKSNKALNIW